MHKMNSFLGANGFLVLTAGAVGVVALSLESVQSGALNLVSDVDGSSDAGKSSLLPSGSEAAPSSGDPIAEALKKVKELVSELLDGYGDKDSIDASVFEILKKSDLEVLALDPIVKIVSRDDFRNDPYINADDYNDAVAAIKHATQLWWDESGGTCVGTSARFPVQFWWPYNLICNDHLGTRSAPDADVLSVTDEEHVKTYVRAVSINDNKDTHAFLTVFDKFPPSEKFPNGKSNHWSAGLMRGRIGVQAFPARIAWVGNFMTDVAPKVKVQADFDADDFHIHPATKEVVVSDVADFNKKYKLELREDLEWSIENREWGSKQDGEDHSLFSRNDDPKQRAKENAWLNDFLTQQPSDEAFESWKGEERHRAQTWKKLREEKRPIVLRSFQHQLFEDTKVMNSAFSFASEAIEITKEQRQILIASTQEMQQKLQDGDLELKVGLAFKQKFENQMEPLSDKMKFVNCVTFMDWLFAKMNIGKTDDNDRINFAWEVTDKGEELQIPKPNGKWSLSNGGQNIAVIENITGARKKAVELALKFMIAYGEDKINRIDPNVFETLKEDNPEAYQLDVVVKILSRDDVRNYSSNVDYKNLVKALKVFAKLDWDQNPENNCVGGGHTFFFFWWQYNIVCNGHFGIRSVPDAEVLRLTGEEDVRTYVRAVSLSHMTDTHSFLTVFDKFADGKSNFWSAGLMRNALPIQGRQHGPALHRKLAYVGNIMNDVALKALDELKAGDAVVMKKLFRSEHCTAVVVKKGQKLYLQVYEDELPDSSEDAEYYEEVNDRIVLFLPFASIERRLRGDAALYRVATVIPVDGSGNFADFDEHDFHIHPATKEVVVKDVVAFNEKYDLKLELDRIWAIDDPHVELFSDKNNPEERAKENAWLNEFLAQKPSDQELENWSRDEVKRSKAQKCMEWKKQRADGVPIVLRSFQHQLFEDAKVMDPAFSFASEAIEITKRQRQILVASTQEMQRKLQDGKMELRVGLALKEKFENQMEPLDDKMKFINCITFMDWLFAKMSKAVDNRISFQWEIPEKGKKLRIPKKGGKWSLSSGGQNIAVIKQ